MWVIFLLGGVFMVYGGILDILIYFEKTLPFAPPPWHTPDTKISLLGGIIVLFAAAYLILKSFEIKSIIEEGEERRISEIKPLIKTLFVVCITGAAADFIAGYYARGFLIGLLGVVYMDYTLHREKKVRYVFSSVVIVVIFMVGVMRGVD